MFLARLIARSLISAAVFGIVTVEAANVGLPDPPPSFDDVVFATVQSPSCETISFADDYLRLTTTTDLVFDNADVTLSAETALQLHVDPASGTDTDGTPLVNVESGYFVVSSGFEVLLFGRVRGATFNPSDGVFEFVIDLEKVSSTFEALSGPASMIVYRGFQNVWVADGVLAWQDSIQPGSYCFTSSPDLFVYADPVPVSNPVTVEAAGPVYFYNESCSNLVSEGEPMTFQYTYDSAAVDLHPDPQIGVYMSCDDSYGSLAGMKIAAGDVTLDAPCVRITVSNDVSGGSPGTELVDFYRVEALGTNEFAASMIFENTSGLALADDSLPVTAPVVGFAGQPWQPYQEVGEPRVELVNDGLAQFACSFRSAIASVAQVGDTDADQRPDSLDNCIDRSNPSQRDSDADGFGNACDPDLDNDGVVNTSDLGIFRSSFFATGNLDADFNSDGSVNGIDLGVMKTFFFLPPGPSALAE